MLCWNIWNVIQMRLSLRRWDHTEKGGGVTKKGEGGGALTALWNETDAIFREIRALREGRGGGGSLLSHISSQKHFHSPICSGTPQKYWDGEISVSSEILIQNILLRVCCQDNDWILPYIEHWIWRNYGSAGYEHVVDLEPKNKDFKESSTTKKIVG